MDTPRQPKTPSGKPTDTEPKSEPPQPPGYRDEGNAPGLDNAPDGVRGTTAQPSSAEPEQIPKPGRTAGADEADRV